MINAISIHRLIIVKWNGNDEWGEPKAPTNVELRGYVEYATTRVLDGKGQEVASQVNVRLPIRRTDAALGRTIDHNDRFIVDGLDRAIASITEPAALKHPRIYRIYLV